MQKKLTTTYENASKNKTLLTGISTDVTQVLVMATFQLEENEKSMLIATFGV